MRLGVRAPAVLLALVLPLAACGTWTVTPPPAPQRPQPVFLLDHGRHASLVLPRAGGMVRYSYGEWEWYALNRNAPYRASGMLFGGNDAGLGRRLLPGPARMAPVRAQVRVPIEHAWRIDVEAARVQRLDRRLDALFARQADAVVDNPLYDLEFVPHPAPYSLCHNSNHVVAGWLRELGARVKGGGPWSRWRVEPPRGGRATEPLPRSLPR